MKIILEDLIHQVQYYFLPKRELKDKFRTALNTEEYFEQHNEKEAASGVFFFFFNAEKAFDYLNWTFLFKFWIKFYTLGKINLYFTESILNGYVAKRFEGNGQFRNMIYQ